MIRNAILAAIVVLSVPQVETAQSSEDSNIRETIKAYEDGFNRRDRKLLDIAFEVKSAHVKSISNGEDDKDRVRVTNCDAWIDKATTTGPNREVKVRILSITQVNDRIANVFLDFDNSLFDMLLLSKIDGKWKILNKVSIYQELGK